MKQLATSSLLLTGSADNSVKLWEVRTGKCLHTWEFKTVVKRVAFSEDDSMALIVTVQSMGYQGTISVYPIANDIDAKRNFSHFVKFYYNNYIILTQNVKFRI
jgi:translation initiation factor 3 subunit I